jgi:hypothetical protein
VKHPPESPSTPAASSQDRVSRWKSRVKRVRTPAGVRTRRRADSR